MSKNQLLISLILVGLLASIVSFVHRFVAEAHNRRVELVVDWVDAQALANTTSRAIDDVLTQLKNAGVTTVAVTEDTLETLRLNGIMSYRRDGESTVLTFLPYFHGQRDRVAQALQHKTHLTVVKLGTDQIRVKAPWPQFNGMAIGMSDDTVQAVRKNHLLVAPRLLNYTGVTADSIRWELGQVQQQCSPQGLGPLIFSGSAVLGFRPLIKTTADVLREKNMTYGSVEFGKTLGDEDLSRFAADRTVRVHSITNDEMGTMEEPTAEERFVRAARERNIRVCYIRLFTNGLQSDPDVIEANTKFISNVVKGMQIARLDVGDAAAHPFNDDPVPNLVLRELMALGVIAAGLLLLRVFTGIDGRPFWTISIIALLLGLGLAAPHIQVRGREILALLAACTFPTLGLCLFALPTAPLGKKLSSGQVLSRAFAAYARMTLASFTGAIFVVGLLSGRLFLLKVDEFLGVKLVLAAPVILVTLYYGLGLNTLAPNASWTIRKARIQETLASILSQQLSIGQVVFGMVALVAFAVVVARSGNDPGVGVSGAELKMRALLDKYLLVRPRTKEFAIGHPALLLALAVSLVGRAPKLVLPLLILGAVGQASIVDTFCHLHSPLFLSMLRAGIGWALGALIGAIVFVLLARFLPDPQSVQKELPLEEARA